MQVIHRQIIDASKICLRVQIYCSVSKCGQLTGDCSRKSTPNLGFIRPFKTSGRYAKCFECHLSRNAGLCVYDYV